MKLSPVTQQYSFKSNKPPKYEIKSVYGEKYECDDIKEVAELINQPISNISQLAGYGEISGYRIQVSPIFKKESTQQKEDRYGVYVIDADGSATKYENLKEACDKLNLNHEKISELTARKNPVGYGYGFLRAKDVEFRDKKNKIRIKESAIQEIRKAIRNQIFYAVNQNGEYQKFFNLAEASEKLGIKHSLIATCLKTPEKQIQKGMCFFPASKVEFKDEDGNIKLDKAKLIEYSQELFRKNAIYSYNEESGLQRFDNIQHALKELEMPKETNVTNCLNGIQRQSNGYCYFRADLIESKDSEGNYKISDRALKVLPSVLTDNTNRIICLMPTGRIKSFKNEFQIAHILNINIEEVFDLIDTNKKTPQGFLLKTNEQI